MKRKIVIIILVLACYVVLSNTIYYPIHLEIVACKEKRKIIQLLNQGIEGEIESNAKLKKEKNGDSIICFSSGNKDYGIKDFLNESNKEMRIDAYDRDDYFAPHYMYFRVNNASLDDKKIGKITDKLYKYRIKEIEAFNQDDLKVPFFKKKIAVRKGEENNWRFYYQISYLFLPANRRDEIESILIIYNEEEIMITTSYIQLDTTNRDQSVEGMQIMWGDLSPQEASWSNM